jgi:hypothetical protein
VQDRILQNCKKQTKIPKLPQVHPSVIQFRCQPLHLRTTRARKMLTEYSVSSTKFSMTTLQPNINETLWNDEADLSRVARELNWDLCFEIRRGNRALREPERAPLGALGSKMASQYVLRLTLPCAQACSGMLTLGSG